MVKMRYYILLFILFFGCRGNVNSLEGDASVSGILTFMDQPLSGTAVSIDGVLNWSVETNEMGYFEIKNVAPGERVLKATFSNNDGMVSMLEAPVVLAPGQNNLNEIKLPVPPVLYDIVYPHNDNYEIKLSWSPSEDSEYREYKVYRKDDSGLDETTGELIYVTTSKTDTNFVDSSFLGGLEYYYRVYTLSSFGKVGGSNLKSVVTEAVNLVSNGGFEKYELSGEPNDWSIPGYNPGFGLPGEFEIDNTEKYSDSSSLRFYVAPSDFEFVGDVFIDQYISGAKFEVGRNYVFKAYLKPRDFEMGASVRYRQNGDLKLLTTNSQVSIGEEWVEITSEFRYPEDANILQLRIYAIGYESDTTLSGWVDNVSISIVN